MVSYGYLPENQTIAKTANVNATPESWTFSAYGINYGGVEIVDPTQNQIDEVTTKGGELFTKEDFETWFDSGQEGYNYQEVQI